MSSVLRKNGWWEEAEPSREHSGMLPGLNEGHVWLPLVRFVLFLSTMGLKACVLSVSPQTLISCMDPWPFNVAVGVCHLIVTCTNAGRHHFLWYYRPPACGLVLVRKQSLHTSLGKKKEKTSKAMTILVHSITESCSYSCFTSGSNTRSYPKPIFTKVRFLSMSDAHAHTAVPVKYR